MQRRDFTKAAGLVGMLAGAGFAGPRIQRARKAKPTPAPTLAPTPAPTLSPTPAPTVAPTPAPTPAPSPSGLGYPFGARYVGYGFGVKVSNHTNSELDASIKAHYDAWKAARIVPTPGVAGGLADKFDNNYLTVSEGMGYAMLITVVMAGHDSTARATFDGLLTTVRARPARGMAQYYGATALNLMDWRLDLDGTSSDEMDLGANAMDGDLDIALALLMADRQWGSAGTWNYRQEALKTIAAIKTVNMRPDGQTHSSPQIHVARTSDFMIGHFRAFATATGDTFWSTTAIDRSYALIDRMQTVYSPNVGLMPDFIINCDTNPVPSPGGYGDFTDTEGWLYANAIRNPWRWGTDYVLSGDYRWKGVLQKMMNFMVTDCANDPAKMATGYRLDGSLNDPTGQNRLYRPYLNGWGPYASIAPGMLGGMIDSNYQGWVNASWDWTDANRKTSYYDSEIQIICKLVASGNWWKP